MKNMTLSKKIDISIFFGSSLSFFFIILLSFLLSPTLLGSSKAQAQIKLRIVADWEAGSIVLLNGYKFVKLNGPGGDGVFMAMEAICNIASDEDIIIEQTGDANSDQGFTLSVSNAMGMGPSCSWSATTSDGTPVEANWIVMPDPSNNRLTGCTIQIPKLSEETIFSSMVSNCNMSGELSSSVAVKTAPKTMAEVTDEYIAAMPTCEDESNCPAGATLELEDERDGKMYTVRKLPDGNLWMVDNLVYDPNNYCETRQTMADPNGSSNASGNFGSGTYGDCVNPEYGGSVCASGDCGYLYNWQAVMQNPSAYYNGGTSIPEDNVTGLCPTGWTLPTGNTSGQFQALQNATSWTATQWADPILFNGIFVGNSHSSGSFYNQGSYGFYWSSTAYDDTSNAYSLRLGNSQVYSVNSGSRNFGFAVRCLREVPPEAPTSMQDVSDEYIAWMPTCEDETNCPAEATLELEDERDGKMYAVRKLPDGNLWMVDNLAYGGTTDNCANKTSFSGYGSASYTNQFGSNTYGDCVDPAYATISSGYIRQCGPGGSLEGECGYLYNWQAAMQHQNAYYNGGTSISQDNVTGLCPSGFI